MVIYADILFLINFIGAYIIIEFINLFKRANVSLKNKVISSVVAALFADVIFINTFPGYINNILYFLSVFFMSIISFGVGVKKIINNMLIFFMINFLTVSVVLLCGSVFKNNINVLIKNNIIYINISSVILISLFCVSYPIVYLFLKKIQARKQKLLYNLTVINKNKSVSVCALFDSGNMMLDPISKKSVIIVEKKYTDKLVLDNQNFIKIPYRTINGKDSMYAFLPDVIVLDNKRILPQQYIAITDAKLSEIDEYNALIGNVGGD